MKGGEGRRKKEGEGEKKRRKWGRGGKEGRDQHTLCYLRHALQMP